MAKAIVCHYLEVHSDGKRHILQFTDASGVMSQYELDAGMAKETAVLLAQASQIHRAISTEIGYWRKPSIRKD